MNHPNRLPHEEFLVPAWIAAAPHVSASIGESRCTALTNFRWRVGCQWLLEALRIAVLCGHEVFGRLLV